MGKRSCLKLVVIGVVSPLVLIQSTPADLMKIDFSIGLSIPSNSWTVESGTIGLSIPSSHWTVESGAMKSLLRGAAGYRPDISEEFKYSTFSQMLVFDKESLTLFSEFLMEIVGGDTDVFATLLDRTALYTPITDFGSNSFEVLDSIFLYDLSRLIGRPNIVFSDMWH
jgi:hypothetical protein